MALKTHLLHEILRSLLWFWLLLPWESSKWVWKFCWCGLSHQQLPGGFPIPYTGLCPVCLLLLTRSPSLDFLPFAKTWRFWWGPEEVNGGDFRGHCLLPPAAGRYIAPLIFQANIFISGFQALFLVCIYGVRVWRGEKDITAKFLYSEVMSQDLKNKNNHKPFILRIHLFN